MQRVQPQTFQQISLIPDFCQARAVLTLAFAMELVAICFILAGKPSADAFREFLLLSLYLQWIGLCCGVVLCWLRGFLKIARARIVFFVCWGFMAAIVMLLANFAWYVGTNEYVALILPSEARIPFVLRHTCIAAIVSLLLLRYFWSRHEWREQVRAEGESRYQALNARIRPHFFFNALNSLAALIATRPAEAEMMVEDLADVFRASLEKRAQMAPLVDEIGIVHAYLRIEKARLGDKLHVEWNVPEEVLSHPVPMLIIQPLVENAVHHGISKLKDPGIIRISVWKQGRDLVVEVENPIPPESAHKSSGNQIAVDNIASRVALIYGDRGSLELGPDNGLFKAKLFLPDAPLKGESA